MVSHRRDACAPLQKSKSYRLLVSLLKERAGFIYLIIEFQLLITFYSVEKGKLGIGQHLQIIDAILREDLPSARRFLLE